MTNIGNKNNKENANKTNTNGNHRNNNNGGVMPCHNNLRRLAYITRPQCNTYQAETKTGLLKILYANPFA